MKFNRSAAILIETLIVISILFILLGIFMIGVSQVRNRANTFLCANKLRQLGIAFHAYHDVHKNLPPITLVNESTFQGKYIQNYYVWTHLILPYIEHENLWKETVMAMGSPHPRDMFPPHIGLQTVVPGFTCPQDGRLKLPITDDRGNTAAYGSYWGVGRGIYGFTAMRDQLGVAFGEISDGLSNSLLIGERPPAGRLYSGAWYTGRLYLNSIPPDPKYSGEGITALAVVTEGSRCPGPIFYGPGRIDNPCDSDHFWSLHKGGSNFLFVDGSVKFIPYSAKEILPKLATIAGGEIIEN